MTIRLNDDQAGALDQLAGVEGVPATEIVRRALRLYARTQRADPAFQVRLRQRQDALRTMENHPA